MLWIGRADFPLRGDEVQCVPHTAYWQNPLKTKKNSQML